MQHLILAIVLLFLSIFLAQAQESNKNFKFRTIIVSVVNALSNSGNIKYALFDKKGFKKQPLFTKSSMIESGISTITFKNVPNGNYAIICYHDENSNGKKDFYENELPKESYGTSNNVILIGPSNFESAKFEVANEDVNLEIKF